MIKLRTDNRTPTLTPEQFASMRDALYLFLGGDALAYMGRIAVNDFILPEHDHDDLYAPLSHDHNTAYLALGKSPIPYNDVQIAYIDASNIKVLAGGKFTDENLTVYTIPEDITLNTTDDLTDSETLTADTWYYVYGGVNSSGQLTFVLSEENDTLPSELAHGRNLQFGVSIYNDESTFKIRAFDIKGMWYRYRQRILVVSGTITTTNTLLNLAPYCPSAVVCGDMTFTRTGSGVTAYIIFFNFADNPTNNIIDIYGTYSDGEQPRIKFETLLQRSLYYRSSVTITTAQLSLQGFCRVIH